jgi:hypothetical protein
MEYSTYIRQNFLLIAFWMNIFKNLFSGFELSVFLYPCKFLFKLNYFGGSLWYFPESLK